MTCTFDRELLALFASGDATETERRQVESHLQGCEECMGIVGQYGALSDAVAGSLAGVSAVRRVPRRRWGALVAAAAAAFVLFGTLQIPAVQAQVARLYSFMTVVEMDEAETTETIDFFNRMKAGDLSSKNDSFASIEEAEAAWGGEFPQPSALPPGMRLDHAEIFQFDDGERWVYQVYTDVKRGRHIAVRISASELRVSVPEGAVSQTVVRGQEAVVIQGSFISSEGEPVVWTPEKGIRLFFPLGELYVEVSTGAGATLEDLVQVAESLQ